jgi:predicted nucleic acid-binding protein
MAAKAPPVACPANHVMAVTTVEIGRAPRAEDVVASSGIRPSDAIHAAIAAAESSLLTALA